MVDTLWLARHGSRLDFEDPEWHKRAERQHDPPLSPDGLVQAGQLADRLKDEGISRIFSSPFLRCVMTADVTARQLRKSVRIEAGFSEWLNPAWFPERPALLGLEDMAHRFPCIDTSYGSRIEPSYPESGDTILKRTGIAIEAVARAHEGAILVVGHGATVYGSVVRLLQLGFEETSKILGEVHYCCLCKLCHGTEGWRLEITADVSHLDIRSGADRFH